MNCGAGKQARWEQIRDEVERMKDSTGRGVDEGIKEAVVALRAFDFPTTASCEGHFDCGYPYPWIEICVLAAEGWSEEEGWQKRGESWVKEKEEQGRVENLKQRQRMIRLLNEFYADRETPFDARLTFDWIGRYAAFRIQSIGGDVMELLPPKEREEKHQLYTKEMNDFSNFLREKFFEA